MPVVFGLILMTIVWVLGIQITIAILVCLALGIIVFS